jgi:hypothetical protein
MSKLALAGDGFAAGRGVEVEQGSASGLTNRRVITSVTVFHRLVRKMEQESFCCGGGLARV